jgi:hypothetical protein
VLNRAADESGRHLEEDFRQEVLDNVRRAYEAGNDSISLNASLPPQELAKLTAWIHERNSRVFGERILAAIEIVHLRRRLRELGEDA